MTQSPAGGLMGGGGSGGVMGNMMNDQMMFASNDFSMPDFDAFGQDPGMSSAIGMDFEREFGLFFGNNNEGLDSLSDPMK